MLTTFINTIKFYGFLNTSVIPVLLKENNLMVFSNNEYDGIPFADNTMLSKKFSYFLSYANQNLTIYSVNSAKVKLEVELSIKL